MMSSHEVSERVLGPTVLYRPGSAGFCAKQSDDGVKGWHKARKDKRCNDLQKIVGAKRRAGRNVSCLAASREGFPEAAMVQILMWTGADEAGAVQGSF